jgi:DNA-directed RNA polymerase subunit M/transcription elongation factor TFIIS
MAIPVVCPVCTARLKVPDSAAGKRLQCPKCEESIPVPRSSTEREEALPPSRDPAASAEITGEKADRGRQPGAIPTKTVVARR